MIWGVEDGKCIDSCISISIYDEVRKSIIIYCVILVDFLSNAEYVKHRRYIHAYKADIN